MKKVHGMNINKVFSLMILFLFVMCSFTVMADESSDAFVQVFRNASGSGNNVIERVVDALYYGLLIMYRGVSVKVSQLCYSCYSYVLFPKNRSWGRCRCPEDERHSCYTDNGDVL